MPGAVRSTATAPPRRPVGHATWPAASTAAATWAPRKPVAPVINTRSAAIVAVWLPLDPVNGSGTPRPDRPRRFLLIANPISGGGAGRVRAPLLAAALQARGCAADVHLTAAPGDACARARAAAGEPFDALVALGGDGTVNEVLNGMTDPTRPLGVLPIGTANVLACELGLPRKVDAAADVLAAGRCRELAIGRCGERRF